MQCISSRDNPAFKAWKKLAQSGRERRKAGLILIEGMHLLSAWQARYGLPERVLLTEHALAQAEVQAWLAANPQAALCQLSPGLLAELADTETPAGVLAVVALPKAAEAPRPDQDALLLDGIQDPGNLGSLLRTAAAAGFQQVLLSADCVGAWSPKVLRAGQGAHFLLQIHEGVDLESFLTQFTGTSLATTLAGEPAPLPLYEAQWQSPLAWIFGSEGQGVRPSVLAAARQRVHIPMPGAVESLNVGAAAAICLFETLRRRRAAD